MSHRGKESCGKFDVPVEQFAGMGERKGTHSRDRASIDGTEASRNWYGASGEAGPPSRQKRGKGGQPVL